jgi:hypothetical protein
MAVGSGSGAGRAAGRASGEAQERDRADTATRDELRDVEEELVSLRVQVESLRSLLGQRDAGPMDLAESAAQITAAEEQEALIEVLEARRETLMRKLESLR